MAEGTVLKIEQMTESTASKIAQRTDSLDVQVKALVLKK